MQNAIDGRNLYHLLLIVIEYELLFQMNKKLLIGQEHYNYY